MSNIVELLRVIADNTARHDTVFIAAVSGGAAFLSAAVTGLLAYFVARLQVRSQQEVETTRLRSTIVTAERLRWLHDIRQRLSSLYAQADMQYNYLKRPVNPNGMPQLQQKLDDFCSEVMLQCNVITLMLNPNQQDQVRLRQALDDALYFLRDCCGKKSTGSSTFDDDRYTCIKRAAFDSFDAIGIQTWNQIERLE